jgi:hypothetical protein
MGLGFVATLVGITVASKSWEYSYAFPYAHPMVALSSMVKHNNGPVKELQIDMFTKDIFVSLGVAVVVFVVGYFIVQKKSVK